MAILNALRDISVYDADLLDHMLAISPLAVTIPELFANAFATFTASALQRCIASPFVDHNRLLFRLANSNNPLHRPVHMALIERVLQGSVDLHQYRYVANMLRGHTNEDTTGLLRQAKRQAGKTNGCGWYAKSRSLAAN